MRQTGKESPKGGLHIGTTGRSMHSSSTPEQRGGGEDAEGHLC